MLPYNKLIFYEANNKQLKNKLYKNDKMHLSKWVYLIKEENLALFGKIMAFCVSDELLQTVRSVIYKTL